MTNIDTIREHLDQAELLTQLAEEAAELGKAALKLRRADTGVNPTPISPPEAFANLLEELADVQTCAIVLGFSHPVHRRSIAKITAEKLGRWAHRLAANHPKE